MPVFGGAPPQGRAPSCSLQAAGSHPAAALGTQKGQAEPFPYQQWAGTHSVLPSPLTCRVLVHQPCEALGSCGGCEGAVAGAAQGQQLPEQPFLLRNCHLEETWSMLQPGATAAPFFCPWSLLWTRSGGRLVRAPSPSCSPPTYVAGQGADEGHEEDDQTSLCLQALPILRGKNSTRVIMVLAASLCQHPHSQPLFQHPSPKHPTHLEGLE